MSLSRLLIKNFRNIEHADLSLSPGFNFLVGANGSGKTSVLEAIYTLGHGRAFRSLQTGRVVRHEQSAFVLHGRLQGDAREIAVGLTKDRQGDSTVRIDGTDGHKVAELALLMPMQLITPEGFTLLNGGPKFRRAFIDWGCFHDEPAFFTAWSNLKRLLKQRNAALRQVSRYAQLRPWDLELIPLAEQISRWRAEYSAAIVEDMADTCQQFLPEFTLTFSFQRGWEKETDYAEVLAVTPINETVKTPREVCQDVTVTRQRPVQDQHQIAGTAIGAIAGGLLGNQVGGGTGKKIATVAGAVGGGYAGNKIQEGMQQRDTYTTTETRCNTVTDTSEKVIGYDVKYQIGDKVSQVRMDRDPGTQIPLSKEGELLLVQKAADFGPTFSVPQKTLKSLLNQVSFSMAVVRYLFDSVSRSTNAFTSLALPCEENRPKVTVSRMSLTP